MKVYTGFVRLQVVKGRRATGVDFNKMRHKGKGSVIKRTISGDWSEKQCVDVHEQRSHGPTWPNYGVCIGGIKLRENCSSIEQ